jgi:hypothetical protein
MSPIARGVVQLGCQASLGVRHLPTCRLSIRALSTSRAVLKQGDIDARLSEGKSVSDGAKGEEGPISGIPKAQEAAAGMSN